MHIAQKEFTIAAPQARVWELLGRIIYRSLPLEQMEVVSETTFFAVLRWRIAFIRLPLRVKVALVDITSDRSLGAVISVKRGIIDSVIDVTFSLSAVNENETGVRCLARARDGGLRGWLTLGLRRRFTAELFDQIYRLLRRLC